MEAFDCEHNMYRHGNGKQGKVLAHLLPQVCALMFVLYYLATVVAEKTVRARWNYT